MKSGYTHCTILLDRSGSMDKVKDETIASCNNFLREQKKIVGDLTLTLAQFNSSISITEHMKPIAEVKELTSSSFKPDGFTALLDSLAKMIISTGEVLSNMKEEDRPSKVVFVVITDGHENASEEYKGESGKAKIAEMIKHQTEIYSWDFVFLGANQDSFATAKSMNIDTKDVQNFDHTSSGVKLMFTSLSKGMEQYRMSGRSNRKFL